ncbi:MAG: hypothetical protein QF744_15690, partial [SAR202 cluster bacterium]|nr:hypothetical protein [SAR202 cluster bacterium]
PGEDGTVATYSSRPSLLLHHFLGLYYVVMPLMGGKELAERLAECHPLIKVMFTSGYTDDQFSQAEMISERAAFVRKPFKPAELARKVREVLDR